MKILVIQMKFIGDVLVGSIIPNNLKFIYPDSEIHYLIYPFTEPVVQGNPNIDKIILFKEEYRKNKIKLFQFLKNIKKEKYDIVVDAYGKIESFLVTIASGASIKIGYKNKHTRFVYNRSITKKQKLKSNAGFAIEHRLSLLSPLMDSSTHLNLNPTIHITENERNIAKNNLSKAGIANNDKFTILSILGSNEEKTYPVKYMAEIIEFITACTKLKIIFNYSHSQQTKADELYEMISIDAKKSILYNFNPGNLRQFMAVCSLCNSVIGNEGGAINIAKALNIPTFAIFSPQISVSSWGTFVDGKSNVAVHVADYIPQFPQTKKEIKKQIAQLYDRFYPSYFLNTLKEFLKRFE